MRAKTILLSAMWAMPDATGLASDIIYVLPSDSWIGTYPMISPDGRTVGFAVSRSTDQLTIVSASRAGILWTFDANEAWAFDLVRVTNDGRCFANSSLPGIFGGGEWTSSGPQVICSPFAWLAAVSEDGNRTMVCCGSVEGCLIYENGSPIQAINMPPDWANVRLRSSDNDLSIALGSARDDWGNGSERRFIWRSDQSIEDITDDSSGFVPREFSQHDEILLGRLGEGDRRVGAIRMKAGVPMIVGPEGSVAVQVSPDRRTIMTRGGNSFEFSRWTPATGIQRPDEFGFDPYGVFDILIVTDFSEDCLSACGMLSYVDSSGGHDAVVIVSLPPSCHLDYATDGMVDFFDYVAFVACFEGDCPNYRSADFNMDGFVDWADYAGFVEAFEIGC